MFGYRPSKTTHFGPSADPTVSRLITCACRQLQWRQAVYVPRVSNAVHPGADQRRGCSQARSDHAIGDTAVEHKISLPVQSAKRGRRVPFDILQYGVGIGEDLPKHRLASRKTVSITELGAENFIAHNVVSPYREVVLREFLAHKVPLHMDVEMPTIETIRKLVERDMGVAFLPRMCVEQEIAQKRLCEVRVKEMHVERKIRLIYPTRRGLSHAAKAFLEVVG